MTTDSHIRDLALAHSIAIWLRGIWDARHGLPMHPALADDDDYVFGYEGEDAP